MTPESSGALPRQSVRCSSKELLKEGKLAQLDTKGTFPRSTGWIHIHKGLFLRMVALARTTRLEKKGALKSMTPESSGAPPRQSVRCSS